MNKSDIRMVPSLVTVKRTEDLYSCPDCQGTLVESKDQKNFLNQHDYDCPECLSSFNYQFVQGLIAGRKEQNKKIVKTPFCYPGI